VDRPASPEDKALRKQFEAKVKLKGKGVQLEEDEGYAPEPGTRPRSGKPSDMEKKFGFRTALAPITKMPRGSKHRATIMAEELLAGQGKLLIRVMIERALLGCPTCLKLCAERLMPAKRESTIQIKVPKIETLGDVPAAMQAVADQVFKGDITLGEGRNAVALLSAWADSMALANTGGAKSSTPEELVKRLREASKAMDAMSSPDEE
jgi:hypothetical protein